jgi:mRNA-degrading endonuclease RelE of RelBE toxin-antitoxin system
MVRIIWPKRVLDALEEIPERDRDLVLEKTEYLETFPEMYPRRLKGPFRRYRWFLAGNWLIYYRFVDDAVYIRAIWPARIPSEQILGQKLK